MHRDLSQTSRNVAEKELSEALFSIVRRLAANEESVALAREHLINVFPLLFDDVACSIEFESVRA